MADWVSFRCLGFLLFFYGVFLLLGLGSVLQGSDLFAGFSPLSQTFTQRGFRQPNLIIRLGGQGATNEKGSYESENSDSKSGSNFVTPEAYSRRQRNGNQEGHTGTPRVVEKNGGELRGEEKGLTRITGNTSNKTSPIQTKQEYKTAIETAARVATKDAEKKPEEKNPAIKTAATTKDVEKKPEDKPAIDKAATRTDVEKKREERPVINVAATTKDEEKKTSSARSSQDGGQARPDFEGVYNNSIYLYAAHYNAITPPVLTIVAVVNRSAVAVVRTVVCLIFPNGYADNDNGGIKVTAWLELLPDHHYTEFAAAHIRCSIPDSVTLTSLSSVTFQMTPEPHGYVNTSISTAGPSSNGNTRTSSYIPPMPVLMPLPRNYTFFICFSPLHRNFGDTTQVIANLELAQVMGAQHAVVYNTSVTKAVDRVLRHYQQKGFLEVLGWRDVPEPVHYKAQMGAINDCLIRNRLRSQYLVYMDFDEMIVPRKHDSWLALLDALRAGSSSSDDFVRTGGTVVEMTNLFNARILREAPEFTTAPGSESARGANRLMQLLPAVTGESTQAEPRLHPSTATASWKLSNSFGNNSFEIGAVSFPARVFLWDKVSNLSKEEHLFANSLHLSYLLKQKHTLQLWPLRSKTIVNPRTVKMMGIHRVVWFLESQHKTLLVNDTVALLQHYRWYSPSVPCVKDVSVLRFASELVRRMKKTIQELGTLR